MTAILDQAVGATAPIAPLPRRTAARLPWGGPGTYLVAVVAIAFAMGPVMYIVLGGFRSNAQITVSPAGLPNPWHWENYVFVLKNPAFFTELLNSTIVAGATTLGVVTLGVMASYVIARYTFRGRGFLYALFASGLMFPVTAAITPLYLLIKDIGLLDSLAGVIIPQVGFALPTTVIILVPFLRAIPMEIEEAAIVDGCSRLSFFFRMMIPLSLPGVLTTGILAFVGSWNAYLLPLFILNDRNDFTLPLGVQQFSSQYSTDTAMVLAFTSLSMIPALLFFSIFERRIVGGLTGAVKG